MCPPTRARSRVTVLQRGQWTVEPLCPDVEAACKTLATQRSKRSGMSWRDGKQAILTIRSLQQSNRGAAAWALLSAHFHGEVIEVRKHGHLQELTLAKKAAEQSGEVCQFQGDIHRTRGRGGWSTGWCAVVEALVG